MGLELEVGEVTKPQKIVLAVLGIVGLIYVYNNFYAPMSDKIEDAQETLQQKTTELREMRLQAQQLDMLEKEFELLEVHLRDTERRLPKTKELPEFIETVTDIASQYGMDVKTLRVDGSGSSEYYQTHPYGFKLTSDYHTLGAFFTQVARLERIFNIKDVILRPVYDKEDNRLLEADLQIVAYTFKK